jgi:murein DD-endopeptidase MepM/ murein hydrolase activator NlpD
MKSRPRSAPSRLPLWPVLLILAALAAAAVGLPTPSAVAAAQSIVPPTTTTTVPAPPEELPAFHLPFPAGATFIVSQGNAGAYSHDAGSDSEFAWDFDMPEGTPVVAAAAGRIVYIKQEYQGGGFTPEYAGKANYVCIEHPDGLHSLYFHLSYQGVIVKEGQYVQAGQMIALSGNTGHSTGPHLHFEIDGPDWPLAAKSIPAKFIEAGVPTTGSLPISTNLFRPRAPAPLATSAGLTLQGVPAGERVRPVYTHQRIQVRVEWEPSHLPVSPPGPTPPTVPVRLVAADSSGTRTVIVTGSTPTGSAAGTIPGLETLQGTLEVTRSGWLTVWAEYNNGDGWSSVADSDGKLAVATLRAYPTDVLVATPGIRTTPATESSGADGQRTLTVDVGTPIQVSFALVNSGAETRHIFRLAARLTTEAGESLLSPETVFRMTPAPVDLFLLPEAATAWSGTLTPLRKGVYTLVPGATDASYIPLALPPSHAEDLAGVRLVVKDPSGPVEPPVDPSTPAFADVTRENPAFAAVQLLAQRGVISGFPNSAGGLPLFRPDTLVSRAQFAKIIVGALGLPVTEADLCSFGDVPKSGPNDLYPDNFVAVAAKFGLTLGTSTDPPLFEPYGLITRRQAGLMAARADPALADGIPGDPWAPATRGEIAILLAKLL